MNEQLERAKKSLETLGEKDLKSAQEIASNYSGDSIKAAYVLFYIRRMEMDLEDFGEFFEEDLERLKLAAK